MKKIFYLTIMLLAILILMGCKMQGGVAHLTFNNIGELGAAAEVNRESKLIEPGDSFTFEVAWIGSKTARVNVKLIPLNDDGEAPDKILPGTDYTVKDGDHLYIDVEYYPED
ncbi:MAG: hypothetical protein KAW12_10700 [Candidatus Aminicenantes bacterium]|nr:hypothetical protein [Candidatus Aminicenantes bacterium]